MDQKLKKISKNELNSFLEKRGPVKIQNESSIQLGIKDILKSLKTENLLILDIGSSNRRLLKNVINVDMVESVNTDFVLDICNGLPFENDAIDLVICTAVLEHVTEPIKVVSEIYRILKPGGLVWIDIPFLQPLHRVPTDYQRYTIDGIRFLLRNFDEIDAGNANDLGTSMSWLLDEFRKVILPKTKSDYLKKIFDEDWDILKNNLDHMTWDTEINQLPEALNVTGAVFFYGKKPDHTHN